MNSDFLERLEAAQTDDDRSWIVTEMRLAGLAEEVQSMVWAAAIGHWFDAEILAVLRPELKDRSSQLYEELQKLSFVETFGDTAYKLHDLTRRLMLDQLWKENLEEFQVLSRRAADYFSARSEEIRDRIEAIYHWIGCDVQRGAQELHDVADVWQERFWRSESETLFLMIREVINRGRTESIVLAELAFAEGRLAARLSEADTAMKCLNEALALFRSIQSVQGEADTLQSMGVVQELVGNWREALHWWYEALKLEEQIGDVEGKAATLNNMAGVIAQQRESDRTLQLRQELLERQEPIINVQGQAMDKLAKENRDRMTHIFPSGSEDENLQFLLRIINRRLKQLHLHNNRDAYEVFSATYKRAVDVLNSGQSISDIPTWFRTTAFIVIKEWSRSSQHKTK
jgi:tetratricopeptide (TPR) repeat protein